MGSEQKRALVAVVISGIFLFGWQKIYSPVNVGKVVQENEIKKNISSGEAPASKPNTNQLKNVSSKTINLDGPLDLKEFFINVAGESGEVAMSNSLSIKNFISKSSLFDFHQVVGKDFFTSFYVEKDGVSKKLVIVNDIKDGGKYQTNIPGLFVKLEQGQAGTRLGFESQAPFRMSLELGSSADRTDNGYYRKLKTYFKGEVSELEFGEDDSLISKSKWFAIDHNYHLFALVGEENKSFSAKSNESGLIKINFNELSNFYEFDLLFVKKNYDYLVTLNNGLSATIEFGFFGFLAIPILRMLQFFYEYFPNYGVAIIILTLLIRLFTFPLQYKSFKSMKKMQKLQPELNKLKEKYQDNPQKMQAETMELFKRSGANPLGGCLPMLLQMPFFFAFYKVLSAAVELVGAPFIFWINDLSTKDPYFVLPVLLAVVMFGQQKLTPTQTADATQQKVMMFMPIVFGFIMKDLPSGLVLYIFISTLFGILQQLYVYKKTD